MAGVAASESGPAFLSLERYGLDEGLSQLSVTSLVEDDAGFLWIGTQEGLNRFDGQHFVVQRWQGESGPVSSSVDALAVDERSRLWIGTNDAGLEVRDLRSGQRWRIGQSDELSHRTVRALLLDGANGTWVGTEAGIDHVDASLTGVRGLGPASGIVGMARAGTGEPYALDSDCRLWRLDIGHREEVRIAASGLERCVALQGASEGVWVATAEGDVLRVSGIGEVLDWLPPLRANGAAPDLSAMLVRAEDGLLLGYADGQVLHVDPEGGQPAQALTFDQPVGSAIKTFHQGASGVLWIGTHTRGLFRVRPLSAAIRRDRFGDADSEAWPGSSIRSFWRGDGVELVGTDTGLAWRGGPGQAWHRVPALGITSIRAIVPAPQGGWWIGSHHGLWHLSPEGVPQAMPALPDPRVTGLLAEGDTLWVATRGGLARFDHGQPSTEGVPGELAGQFLTGLMRDDIGRLWIGSNERGLFRVALDGSLENLSPDNGRLPHNSVWSLYADAEAFWVGTFAGGLLRLDRGSGDIRTYTVREGLSNDVVYAILPDRRGRLWLSTNNGLSVLDPYRDLVQTLGPRDGLRNREYNSGAGFLDADGMLYFGGTEGLDVIEPEALAPVSPAAIPAVARLEVIGVRGGVAAGAGRQIEAVFADRVQLDHRDTVLALDLVAIDFTAPEAARLRYRIEGVQPEWIYLRRPHAELTLSHLPPGIYALEVAAAGRDGRYGAERRLLIEVPPPFWHHPLAYAAYLLVVVGALGLFALRIGARARAREARIVELDRIVAERTAELERANRMLRASNRQLDEATRTDPLTHVSNRRDLQQWLAREGIQIVRETATVGQALGGLVFFMVDIDDFKRINDEHGHAVGDEVLVAFAARLSALSRGRDVVVRWGGEEFLWMLRDLRLEDASGVAERLRRAIADTPFRLPGGGSLAVTCSIGFAPWPFSARHSAIGDWEQSVHLADRALYAAKRGGKNAWVGLVPGPEMDRPGLQLLLSGVSLDRLAPGIVETPHSTPAPPRFPER